MARYAQPVCRICRHVGDKLFLKGSKCVTKCTLERRPQPPGQVSKRRRRISERGLQLREKQKARYSYGLMERQFQRVFNKAQRIPGITSDNLVVLLERRLDNVVYRLGFADSRPQARQLVSHGHILVNGRKTNVPSALVKEGDIIGWRGGSKKSEYFKLLAETIQSRSQPNWLTLERENMVGRVVSLPTPDEAGVPFDGKAIIEFYSR